MLESNITIRRYELKDEDELFALLEREGGKWSEYWCNEGREKYTNALRNSVSYLLFLNNQLCGFLRCHDDDGFGVYVYDLLVDRVHRGNEYGRLLMEQVCRDFYTTKVYVMGDNYTYYEKMGYEAAGMIYAVKKKTCN